MSETHFQIRRAAGLSDYEACVAIQREVWSFTDPADYASIPLLKIGNTYGGCVLVAEDRGGEIRGFTYALLGRRAGREMWWSHMTAVAAEARGTGVGFDLKVTQRREALGQGITEILWTFDPLRTENAHFNIRKLGVTAQAYESSFYGVSTSPLHSGLPTDRLVAHWNLSQERVTSRVQGTSSLILRDFDGIVRVLEGRDSTPGPPRLDHTETPVLVEVPTAYPIATGGQAAAWQRALRETLGHYLGRGYRVTDFILVKGDAAHAFYVLERGSGTDASLTDQ